MSIWPTELSCISAVKGFSSVYAGCDAKAGRQVSISVREAETRFCLDTLVSIAIRGFVALF